MTIVFIESDCFILSEEMRTYIREQDSGWTSFAQFQYRNLFEYLRIRDTNVSLMQELKKKLIRLFRPIVWAESAVHVVNKDAFHLVRELWDAGVSHWSKSLYAEIDLPYTHIDNRFIGGRYSELGMSPPKNVDFIAQTPKDFSVD